MNIMLRVSISCVLATVLLLAGCDDYKGRGTAFLPDAQGAPYEVIVVADHAEWDGAVGDTLRTILLKRFPKINHEEPSFTPMRVLPSGFNKLITRHRNIIVADVDTAYKSPALGLANDKYAKPQIVLSATAPDAASLVKLIDDNRENIELLLENAEKDRDVAAARGHTPKVIAELVKGKFGFEISTGPGYTVRSESENFLWMSYELPTSSQGIIIYTYPFSGPRDFELENLLRRRDEFVARIPAENPGSHMTTNPESGYIDLVYKKIDGRQWAEMLGHWDTVGDFMGGPYRNYSTLDAANQRVIAIDFYVYAPDPSLKQRNYVKQLEHFLYTVNIPGKSLELMSDVR